MNIVKHDPYHVLAADHEMNAPRKRGFRLGFKPEQKTRPSYGSGLVSRDRKMRWWPQEEWGIYGGTAQEAPSDMAIRTFSQTGTTGAGRATDREGNTLSVGNVVFAELNGVAWDCSITRITVGGLIRVSPGRNSPGETIPPGCVVRAGR